MELNEVRDLVDLAMADLIPRGIEHAWERQDGTVLKWQDIRDALAPVVGVTKVAPKICGERANDVIYDEASMPKEDDGRPTVSRESAGKLTIGTTTDEKTE